MATQLLQSLKPRPAKWFWEDGVLEFHELQSDGYQKVESSGLLADLPVEVFCRYITYFDQYEAVKEFKQLIRLQSCKNLI